MENVEDFKTLQDGLIAYWQNISAADIRDQLVRDLQYRKDQFLSSVSLTGAEIEEEIELLDAKIADYNAIDDDHYFELVRRIMMRSYQSLDPERLRNSHVFLEDSILHELGHALGLNDYDRTYNYKDHPLMSRDIPLDFQNLMTSPRPIDDDVRHSLSCTYDFES